MIAFDGYVTLSGLKNSISHFLTQAFASLQPALRVLSCFQHLGLVAWATSPETRIFQPNGKVSGVTDGTSVPPRQIILFWGNIYILVYVLIFVEEISVILGLLSTVHLARTREVRETLTLRKSTNHPLMPYMKIYACRLTPWL